MIAIRRLNKNSILAAPIYNATVGHFSTQSPTPSPNSIPSTAQYDDLINAAGRKRDFAAVRYLLSKRLSDGCLNTNRTFKFIATDVSVLDELLQNLAAVDNWIARRQAHDALVAQLANLYRTDAALRVARTMARKNYGVTAATFHPILNALARKKEMFAAWRVIEVMRACNIQPAVTSYNYILTAYCFIGDAASAADTLVKMEAEGLGADAMTYDALVLGACRARKVEAALAMMRRMVADGIPVTSSSYTHIIKELVECGYNAQALEFVMIFAGRDENLDAENFGFLARRLMNKKRITETQSVVEEMVKRGLPIDHGIEEFISKFPGEGIESED